jgi:hypothetical protein
MCKRIINEWDLINHHHKKIVNKEVLMSGTGYNIRKYPSITMNAAELWYSDYQEEIKPNS